MKRITGLFLIIIFMMLSACGTDSNDQLQAIVFADAGWDSIRIHNSIAQKIVEEGYDYDTEVTTGSSTATVQGLRDGDINVYMELWVDNLKELYEEVTVSGDVVKVSTNFSDIDQGLHVPTYVIEGDKERGIDPIAPDLRTVEDLKKYPHIFKDPENPKKGRIINSPTGWLTGDINDEKFQSYGLDELYTIFKPGSETALTASLIDAYNAGEPWVGSYWSPTVITAQYDLTLLQEPAFDQEIWDETKATTFPPTDIVVAVHKDLENQAEEVFQFLQHYETSNDLTEAALRYMLENDADEDEAAVWWMKEHEDIWMNWLPTDIAEKVQKSL